MATRIGSIEERSSQTNIGSDPYSPFGSDFRFNIHTQKWERVKHIIRPRVSINLADPRTRENIDQLLKGIPK